MASGQLLVLLAAGTLGEETVMFDHIHHPSSLLESTLRSSLHSTFYKFY
jgi:hypothetical protein